MAHRKGAIAAAVPGSGSTVCFVGNIPYDTTEEQLIEIFSRAGPVQAFRLVFDRETGKPKGYGFCEFFDAETAASAVRNLNNYEIGNRTLRVDFADNEKPGGPTRGERDDGGSARATPAFAPQPFGVTPVAPYAPAAPTPSHTPSAALPAVGAQDPAVAKALALFTNEQLLELMSQMKLLATNSPDQARALLQQTPPLAYALFQIMLVTKLVDVSVVQQTMQQQQVLAPAPMMAPMPPVGPPAAYAQPAPYGAQPSLPPALASQITDPQQAALINQVLSLSQQQIDALAPDQRATVMALKAQLMGAS